MGNSVSTAKEKKQRIKSPPRLRGTLTPPRIRGSLTPPQQGSLSPPQKIPQPVLQFFENKPQQVVMQLEPQRDDQVVQYQQEQVQQVLDDAVLGQMLDRLHAEFIPLYNPTQVGTSSLPVVLKIETQKGVDKQKRAPIDLVCVVDVSGSMEGQKLDLVKDSLRYLQKILSPEDRISIVTFSTYANPWMGWTRNIPENKQFIKDSILKLRVEGSTNIASGVEEGLKLIANRKYKNPVTCMFLLSDGQDDEKNVSERTQQIIEAYAIKDVWALKVFGYGKDHDAKSMDLIASLKHGTFAFIEDIKKASEHFILAMSGMLSLYGKNINIQVKANDGAQISKIYGEDLMWKVENGVYMLEKNFLVDRQSEEFVIQIQVPEQYKDVKPLTALQMIISGEFLLNDHKFSKQQVLELNFSEQQSQANPITEIFYLKAKSAEVITQAVGLAEMKKNDDGIQLINKMIDEVEASSQLQNPTIQHLLQDLQKSKEMCKQQVFQQQGQAYMKNKGRNLIMKEQVEMEYSDGWNSEQEENMQQFKQGRLQLSVCDMREERDDLSPSGFGRFHRGSNYSFVLGTPERQNSLESIKSNVSFDFTINRRSSR